MTDYDFVRIGLRRGRAGFELAEDYREIIRERAAAGWTFVQAIPFEQHADAHLDLVFRRKSCKHKPSKKGDSQ